MKSKPKLRELPAVSKAEAEERLPKSAAIFFRLSAHDKKAVDAAARSLHLSTAEYLLKCHELVASKLQK